MKPKKKKGDLDEGRKLRRICREIQTEKDHRRLLYPPAVYEAVKDWAVKEYGWAGRPIVRPFWPGGDYENFDYPPGAVVIDNPPFSIVSKIAAWYEARRIDYFLFAPGVTLLAILSATSHIGVSAKIRYENGAVVNTSFISSQGPLLRSAPELYRIIDEIHQKACLIPKNRQIIYRYPDSLITSTTLSKFSRYGIEYASDTGTRVNRMDAQIGMKKSIFGGGYIVPREEAVRAQEAVRKARAAELAKAAGKKIAQEEAVSVRLDFSTREEAIAASLERR